MILALFILALIPSPRCPGIIRYADLTGPGEYPPGTCADCDRWDWDRDWDVDMLDFAKVQISFTRNGHR